MEVKAMVQEGKILPEPEGGERLVLAIPVEQLPHENMDRPQAAVLRGENQSLLKKTQKTKPPSPK